MPAAAERALLLIDAGNDRVLYARNANLASYPASLTKLMTAYVLLEAVKHGGLTFATRVTVSSSAAAQLPRKLRLRAGQTLTIEQVLLAVIVYSANDAAVVAAEAVAGSEADFVTRMNRTAQRLGMTRTQFRNATGLPDSGQITTARDMAVLARALRRDFPAEYRYFSKRGFDLRGRHVATHNNFVTAYPGADGLKTGFTCHAGYNLVASATRAGGQLIGVVLGEATRGARDRLMKQTFDKGYSGAAHDFTGIGLDSLAALQGQGAGLPANGDFLAEICIHPERASRGRRDRYRVRGWSLEIGFETELEQAEATAGEFLSAHPGLSADAGPLFIPRWVGTLAFRVAVTGLQRMQAAQLCRELRASEHYCLVLSEAAATHAVQHGQAVLQRVSGQD